jgi:hypothetical protein
LNIDTEATVGTFDADVAAEIEIASSAFVQGRSMVRPQIIGK